MHLEITRILVGLDRLVGVVSPNYFPSHTGFGDTVGVHFSTLGKLLYSVIGVVPQSVPHEIAHSYGAGEKYTETDNETLYDGTPIDGYDALTHKTYLLMSGIWSIMGPYSDVNYLYDKYWIDNDTYMLLFKKMKSDPDPATIMISGILDNTGTFNFGPSAALQSGALTSDTPNGNIRVSTLDSSGNELDSINLTSDFTAQILYKGNAKAGPSTMQMSAMPIVVELPLNPNISSFAISKNGKILKKTSALSQTLQGIIESIPDDAFQQRKECFFRHCKSQTEIISDDRNILNQMLSVAQKQINAQQNMAAIITLDILVLEIKALTYSRFVSNDLAHLDESDVIADIRNISDQLKSKSKLCAKTVHFHRFNFFPRLFCH